MRELPKISPECPSVQVFNSDPRDEKLHKQAIFIVPYLDFSGTYRVGVYHAELSVQVEHAAKGLLGGGICLDAVVLKDFELTSKQDPQRQVDGYLALIRQTPGPPISVASVGLLNFGRETLDRLIFNTYSVAYLRENAKQLAHLLRQKSSEAYGIFSRTGIPRLLLNRHVTVSV